ncbi:hypothetical protein D9M72_394480 [compost metagenome]
MASAELRAGRVPEQFHDLDALDVPHIVRAADILRQVAVDLGIAEVTHGGRQVDQPRGNHLADRLDDTRIGLRHEGSIGKRGFQIGKHGAVGPRNGIVGHGIGEAPEHVAERDHLAECCLIAAEGVAAGGAQRLGKQACQEVEFHGETGAALEAVAVHEAGSRVEGEDLGGIAQDQDVLPRHEDVVEHQDRIVLVEARRQRIVEGMADGVGCLLVGDAAEHLDPGRVHRNDEHHRERGILRYRRRTLRQEIVVRQCRGGRDHLGT